MNLPIQQDLTSCSRKAFCLHMKPGGEDAVPLGLARDEIIIDWPEAEGLLEREQGQVHLSIARKSTCPCCRRLWRNDVTTLS